MKRASQTEGSKARRYADIPQDANKTIKNRPTSKENNKAVIIGRTSRITHYVHNLKEGKEIYYNPAGKVDKEITFKQDRIVSQYVDSTLIP